MSSILLIQAHPDDETFIAGGTIAKYAARGIEIDVICATRGERGKHSDLCTVEELPRVREAELREAARILGAREIEMLPYRDKELSTAPPDEIRRALVAAIRRWRPRIALSFDPNGMNQHADHIAIGRFAADAVSAAADPRWYPETGEPHDVERMLWSVPIPVFNLGRTENLATQPGIDFLIDIAEFRAAKTAALRAHRTQYPGLRKLFHDDASTAVEAFRLAWGRRPSMIPVRDLFA